MRRRRERESINWWAGAEGEGRMGWAGRLKGAGTGSVAQGVGSVSGEGASQADAGGMDCESPRQDL